MEGNLAHRVHGFRTPELNDLGGAFNAMAGRIEATQVALSELATRDGLTGLLNHRELVRLLSEELERARRYDRPCSLLLMDVDHFKAINDNWGTRQETSYCARLPGASQTPFVQQTVPPAMAGKNSRCCCQPETDR